MKKFLTLLTGAALIFSVKTFSQLSVRANSHIIYIELRLPTNSNIYQQLKYTPNQTEAQFEYLLISVKDPFNKDNNVSYYALPAVYKQKIQTPYNLPPGDYLILWTISYYDDNDDAIWNKKATIETYTKKFTLPSCQQHENANSPNTYAITLSLIPC
jgi:hypothetical protein